jgi:hypothetical protein
MMRRRAGWVWRSEEAHELRSARRSSRRAVQAKWRNTLHVAASHVIERQRIAIATANVAWSDDRSRHAVSQANFATARLGPLAGRNGCGHRGPESLRARPRRRSCSKSLRRDHAPPLTERLRKSANARAAAPNFLPLRQARPTSMLGTDVARLRCSMRCPSSDQRR